MLCSNCNWTLCVCVGGGGFQWIGISFVSVINEFWIRKLWAVLNQVVFWKLNNCKIMQNHNWLFILGTVLSSIWKSLVQVWFSKQLCFIHGRGTEMSHIFVGLRVYTGFNFLWSFSPKHRKIMCFVELWKQNNISLFIMSTKPGTMLYTRW